MNLVLTLVIVTDEAGHYDAVQAATEAGREHPSRVIALILRDPGLEPALDAEIRRPGTFGPGETVLCGCTVRSPTMPTRWSPRCWLPEPPWWRGGRRAVRSIQQPTRWDSWLPDASPTPTVPPILSRTW